MTAKTKKIREELLHSIKEYFKSEQWLTLQNRIENDSENTLHAHIFVDTTLHPDAMSAVLREYYKAKKMDIARTIDYQPSNVGHNMLHGIYPKNTFHYDLAWRFEPNSIIKPMPSEYVKEKNNLQIWDKKDIEEFFSQYDFSKAEGDLKKELRDFFESDYWIETKGYVEHPEMAHFHANIETSIHPDDIRDAALQAIDREGWKVQKVLHCIFSPQVGWTTGKIVFMLEEPEVMWDIAWKYNGDVGIRPSTTTFMLEDSTEFDVRYKETMEFYTSKGEFVNLTDAELKRIGQLFAEN